MSPLGYPTPICPTACWTPAGHLAEAPMTTAVSLVIASPLDRAEGFRTSLVQTSKRRAKGRKT